MLQTQKIMVRQKRKGREMRSISSYVICFVSVIRVYGGQITSSHQCLSAFIRGLLSHRSSLARVEGSY
jgi:hypothetical protein